jgi:methylated-DNA-[protein]-cysteine S-methyltransferase
MTDSACQNVYYAFHSSPIGDLLLTSDGQALTGLFMRQHKGGPLSGPEPHWRRDDAVFHAVVDQLSAYFKGNRLDFDLTLRMAGTPFQRQVWDGLRALPHGTTVSYADLAGRIGRPGASRAVGSANGRNPISIIVPCHRVIAADGTLGGYGGGLDRKQWLLEHEASVLGDDQEIRGASSRTSPASGRLVVC